MSASRQSFFLVISDLAKARGKIEALSFAGNSAEYFADQLQAALREGSLWQRWKTMQPDPDAVDPALGASDPHATVVAHQVDLHCEIQVTTTLPHSILKHRLGTADRCELDPLRDVQAA